MNTDTRNYSQITFDFTEIPVAPGIEPAIGARVKTLKPVLEEVQVAEQEMPETDIEVQEAEPIAVINEPVAVVKKSTRGRKSLKALDAEADLVAIPADEILFQRQYYSIGEVAEFFRVNQSLLRFWENEFDIIQPRKNRKGDRHFRPIDIKNLELIYDLLRRRKLTIEGAKNFLKKNKKAKENFALIQSLQDIKGYLQEIKASL